MEGMGKLGLVCDIDREANGYFISFDVSNGLVKIRAWSFNPLNTRQNFIFTDIQSAFLQRMEKDLFISGLSVVAVILNCQLMAW